LRVFPPSKLEGWVAANLQPSTDFTLAVKETVRHICEFLKQHCFENGTRVLKTVKGGSAGKGTALRNNSDADVVLFLNCFSSYRDQQCQRTEILTLIEKRLLECSQSLSFTVSITKPRYKGRSLSLTLHSSDKLESIDVDILPAYDALGRDRDGAGRGTVWDGGQGPSLPTGQVTQDGPPDPKVYVNLLAMGSSPGEFSTCFTELQKKFVKRCSAKPKDLLRLVKYWYKQVLKPQYPGAELPPKYALELLSIYAWEQGTASSDAFSMADGFRTVLELLCQYQDICVYWEKYYSLQHEQIGTHLKALLRQPRPVILDPADPTGILGQGKQWDLVAKEAARCRALPCVASACPWNVQPARPVTVKVKQLQGTTLSKTVSPSTTILELKAEIEQKWGIPRYQQRLAQHQPAGNSLILHDRDSLATHGIFYDTMLLLLQTPPQEMEIFVNDFKNKTNTYIVQRTDTVWQLKMKIYDRQGVPAEQQCLTYGTKQLENHNTLEHYDVQPKSTIYLLLRLRGGTSP
ncbi:OASL2 protein, partial [Chauna torquata]|nr:OASL2 protein [Chauna torquata]